MGFETVVRPVVLPDIRPKPWRTKNAVPATTAWDARTISSATPEGYAVIRGNPAKQINLTITDSVSISRSVGQETQRRVDRVRVYQKEDDNTVNKDNFVDLEVTNRMKVQDASGTLKRYYKRAKDIMDQEGGNIELLVKDIIYDTKYGGEL